MVDAQLNINLFDAIVYIVLVFSAGISAYRGFIREFLSLATWFGAGLITLSLADNATSFMKQHMTSNFGAALIGILGTYFLIVISLGILSRLFLRYVREGSEIGWPDHIMGMLFGFFKGGLVIVLGFILMTLIFKQEGYPEWVKTASTLPAVQGAAVKVVRALPDELGIISSLGQPTEEELEQMQAEQNGEVPTPESIDAGIGAEINTAPQSAQPPAPSPLEQLILDATKERP